MVTTLPLQWVSTSVHVLENWPSAKLLLLALIKVYFSHLLLSSNWHTIEKRVRLMHVADGQQNMCTTHYVIMSPLLMQ